MVLHVLPDASDDVLRRRIEASPRAWHWRLDHLTEYRQARGWLGQEADLVLDTAALTGAQAARESVSALPSLERAFPRQRCQRFLCGKAQRSADLK
jgi:hypothetical protein